MSTSTSRRAPVGAAAWQPDVVDLLAEGVVLHGADGRIECANAAAHELLAETELVGRDGNAVWSRLVGPSGVALGEAENPLRVVLVTGRAAERVVGVRDEAGGVRWLTVRAVPLPQVTVLRDEDVPAPEAVAVVVAAPADGEALGARADRDHLLGVAQRLAHLTVWRYRLGTGGVEWLDGDDRDLGTDQQQRTMEQYLSGVHPDDRAAHDELFTRLLAEPGAGEIDVRYRWEDGWRHWHMWAESVVGEDGRITGLWGTTQEVTDRREAEAAVRRLTMTDPLTGLANRAQAEDRLADLLAHAGTGTTGLLLIDVDRFHSVNTRYGHPAGDALLVAVGRRLALCADSGCTPTRLGADEFGMVLGRTDPAHAARTARELHARLSQPYELPGVHEPVTVRFSVGVVVASAAGRLTPSELYHQADLAAAAAKAAGGDDVVVFDGALRARTVTRLEMEDRLRLALSDGSLQPLYQPLVSLGADVSRDRVTGCEALARLSRDGRLVPPVEFIDVAEETGLIVDLDVAVFAEAVRQVATTPPHAGFGLAVNLSPRSLQVPGLAGRVRGVLGSRAGSGTALRFEITESSLAEPTSTLVENLRGLRELGGRIGLDDFGTGYSALSYLRRFELDFMKIDRSFVTDVCADRRAASIVQAVIELAHAHDLTVVAEGVETADQLEALRRMRCDMVQGYHLGRPMPAADLLRLAA
ncbi:MAG TPA: bifunctional diguanylate cyclase/phosphodiesterase [Angustibacter sp.]|nr:bifunctional diguanylate cyclase/phosphodiesterase [Angustibacter sp.]